jgi:predicted dehydrogenase
VALSGQRPDKAAAAAATLSGARGFGSWREMLDAGELHAVSLAVPPAAQPEIAIAAAERGLAVFCEKPAAGDMAHAEAMLAAVRRHGVAHAINFLFPEIAAWQAAKRAVSEMAARQPLRSAALVWRVETYAHRHDLHDSWKRSPAQGGGALSTFVSHSAYALEWLFGPIRRVLARLLPSADDDAQVSAWLDFDSGLHATLDVATNSAFGSGHHLEVYGHDGAVRLGNSTADYVRGFDLEVSSRTGNVPVVLDSIHGDVDGRIWATAQIASRFVDRIRSGGTGGPDLADGLRVQRLIEIFRESSATSSWVEVPRASG